MAANSLVNGGISPNFELIQSIMYIIVTCKYEVNQIKTPRKCDDAVFATVTLSVAIEASGCIWTITNSSDFLCIASLPANMKGIQLKIAEKM